MLLVLSFFTKLTIQRMADAFNLSHYNLINTCQCVGVPACASFSVVLPSSQKTPPKAEYGTANTEEDPFVERTTKETIQELNDNRLKFSGNIWQRGKEQDLPSTQQRDTLLSAPNQEVRKGTIRLLGFYSQLAVFTICTLLLGYWWMVSPLTEGFRYAIEQLLLTPRWLILPLVNLPIFMFLTSIYVFHYIYYWGVPPSRPSPNYLPSEEEASKLALFRWFPHVFHTTGTTNIKLRHNIAWVRLLDTSRSAMTQHSIELDTPTPQTITIYFKREDLNSKLYSGVKPRTLEFLMASCEANHYHRKELGIVSTNTCTLYAMGAPGSNQSAATFTHASKVKGTS